MSVSDFYFKKIKNILSLFLYRVAVDEDTGGFNFDELFFQMKLLCENFQLLEKEILKGKLPEEWS